MVEAVATASETTLWDTWRRERAAATRSALFFHYADWGRIIAASTMSRHPHALAEWRDYVQLASIGMLKAIDRFDPSLGSTFKAYAEPYIRGEILKGLACYIKDRPARAYSVQDIKPEPSDGAELYSLEDLVDVAVGLAFGHFLELGIVEQPAQDNEPLAAYESTWELGALMGYVERLPEREQQVVVAHYFQSLPFAEIAELLAVSRPRVSQLHQRALSRIREWYETDSAMTEQWF